MYTHVCALYALQGVKIDLLGLWSPVCKAKVIEIKELEQALPITSLKLPG